MKIGIVEDEKLHQDLLISMLEQASREHKINLSYQVFTSADQILFLLDDLVLDALLLDIKMVGMTGFQLAEKLRNDKINMPIAFITGERDYVFKGYDVDACAYLLKPIKQVQVNDLLGKLKHMTTSQVSFDVQTKEGLMRFLKNDIILVESQNHKTIIHSDKFYEANKKLGEWENMLINHDFYKPHRSYLINLNMIHKIDNKFIHMSNSQQIPIARGKRDDLMKVYMAFRRKDFQDD